MPEPSDYHQPDPGQERLVDPLQVALERVRDLEEAADRWTDTDRAEPWQYLAALALSSGLLAVGCELRAAQHQRTRADQHLADIVGRLERITAVLAEEPAIDEEGA